MTPVSPRLHATSFNGTLLIVRGTDVRKLLSVTTMMFASGAAIGASDTPMGSPLIAALAHCTTIRSDAERLACMDAATAKLVTAERARDVVVVSRDEVKKTKRSLFGLSIDQNAVFTGHDAPADRVEDLDTTLIAASPNGDRWSLALAEGGHWRTTEPWRNADPKPGMAVEIRHGALGSYVLRAKGQTTVRVMRIN